MLAADGFDPSTSGLWAQHASLRHAALLPNSDEKVYIGLLHGKQIVNNTDSNAIARKKYRPIRDLNP